MKAKGSVEYPGPPPGDAWASIQKDQIVLTNRALECRWSRADGHLRPVSIMSRHSGTTLSFQGSECFQLLLGDGRVWTRTHKLP